MHILTHIKKVQSSPTFRSWKAGFPQAFLSSIFVMVDGKKEDWQALYYDPKSELSTGFLIEKEITLVPPEPTFKEPDRTVQELDLNVVKLDLPECLALCQEEQKSSHPTAIPSKIIAILQHLQSGQVYNVTYVTKMLSTLNIKVNAETKKIEQSTLIPIISFGKR